MRHVSNRMTEDMKNYSLPNKGWLVKPDSTIVDSPSTRAADEPKIQDPMEECPNSQLKDNKKFLTDMIEVIEENEDVVLNDSVIDC